MQKIKPIKLRFLSVRSKLLLIIGIVAVLWAFSSILAPFGHAVSTATNDRMFNLHVTLIVGVLSVIMMLCIAVFAYQANPKRKRRKRP